jgi:predicted AAA+ superfamily ATPase
VLLEEAFLVAALSKHSVRASRQRAAPPKLVTLNNALLAVMDPGGVPRRAKEPERWGAWVENACLAYAWNAGQRVSYWREEPFEVDGVLEGSWGSWAIEVKTGRISLANLKGLGEFVRRHQKFRPLVVCDDDADPVARRAGFEAIGWRDFLLHGPGPR